MNREEIKHKNLRWLNITKPTSEEIEYLKKNFSFHPADLEDSLVSSQRSKVEKRGGYYFLILHFPIYLRQTREIKPVEVDFFIGSNYLISIHDNLLPPLLEFFQLLVQNSELRQKILGGSITELLFSVLEKLFLYIYPMLDHLYLDIANIEKEIFADHEKKMVKEIQIIRRNITDFRKIMQVHKKMMQALASGLPNNHLPTAATKNDIPFNILIEHTKEIWDVLEVHKEAIEALHDTNESLISNRMNEIMRVLTSISVTIFSLTLLVNIFSLDTISTPFKNHPLGFWIIIGLNAVLFLILFLTFKRKKWI